MNFTRKINNYKKLRSDSETYEYSSTVLSSTNSTIEQSIPLCRSTLQNVEKEIDVTTKVTGEFGKWQLWITIAMALIKLPMAWYQLNIIFMAPPQDFWCKKPKSFRMYTDEKWRRLCSPIIEEYPCFIYDPDVLLHETILDRTRVKLVQCKEFEYDHSTFNRTITSDWNLVCSRHWLVHFTQCLMMWGILIGSLIYGMVADKHGRRITLLTCLVQQCVCSFICALMPTYWSFLVFWFLLSLAIGGLGVISFVMSMEVVSGKWRTIAPVLTQLPYGGGNAIMAVIAYWFRDWRKLELALATLSLFYCSYWIWLPESPRWLIATGRTEEALRELRIAAKVNKRDFNAEEVRRLMPTCNRTKSTGFMLFFKYKNMRNKTILLSLNWFCTGLAFYTFSQYLGAVGSNVFWTVAICGIISIPGGVICVFVVTKVGRRTTIWLFQVMTALCFICILLIPRNKFENDWPRIACASLGFSGMAGSVPALYLYSGECYPTQSRNVGVGGVSMFARIGSMIAPVVVSLNDYKEDLPVIIIAAMTIMQMLFIYPLPETKGRPLPDTLEDAEKF